MVLNEKAPRVLIIDDIISPSMCDTVISLAKYKLKASATGAHTSRGYEEGNKIRNSRTAWLSKHDTMLVKKLADFLNCNVDHTESMQVVNYQPGEYYKPHLDTFSHRQKALPGVGQRVCTCLLYLNDIPTGAGGETGFPNLKVKVKPKKGRLLIWELCDENLVAFPDALHESCTLLEGEKWVANLWLLGSYDLPQ